jgi:dTDP-6-deoxy-L-talose 4-dehydrogenase (NAD+)
LKIAVTGATGFVGRHLLPALLARGAQVVAACRDPARLELDHERLAKIAFDLDQPDAAFVRLGEPDVLLHLAWGGLPNYASAVHLEQELPRQLAFLRACAEQGLRRLVVAGTCLEYGMQSGCLSEDSATAPVTAYGRAKDELRRHLQEDAAFAGVDLTWLRLFYLYGPGQAASSLYSQLRAAVAAGAEDFPMSPGDQQRDFLPIEAAAGMIARLAMRTQADRILNVCSGRPVSVLEMARERLREWGAQLRLLPGAYPYPDFESMAYWGDTRRLTAALEAK